MKKYISFFRLRFAMGLQYRAAALAGMVTQFFWGGMNILMYAAFYESDPAAFPMGLDAVCTYVWLQQAFLSLFMLWQYDNSIFEAKVACIDEAIGVGNVTKYTLGETYVLQHYGIHTMVSCRIATKNHIGWHVLLYAASTLYKRITAHTHMLVYYNI